MTHPPITDEMVERAAMKMYEHHFRLFVQPLPEWDDLPHDWQREVWRDRAREVLEAALSGKEE